MHVYGRKPGVAKQPREFSPYSIIDDSYAAQGETAEHPPPHRQGRTRLRSRLWTAHDHAESPAIGQHAADLPQDALHVVEQHQGEVTDDAVKGVVLER